MLLGNKPHTAGNAIRYEIDYSDWLEDGVSLLTATVTGGPSDITITAAALLTPHKVVFKMSGGSVNETFTLSVQVTDSRGETKNDTVGFAIIAP